MPTRRPRLLRARRAIVRRLVDGLLSVSAWVIERRLLAATGDTGREEPRRHLTMRL